MPNRRKPGEGANDDLDQTDELAVLDVVAYEARMVEAGTAPVYPTTSGQLRGADRGAAEPSATVALNRAREFDGRLTALDVRADEHDVALARLSDVLAQTTSRLDTLARACEVLQGGQQAERQQMPVQLAATLGASARRIAFLESQFADLGARVAETEHALVRHARARLQPVAECRSDAADVLESEREARARASESLRADLLRRVAALEGTLAEHLAVTATPPGAQGGRSHRPGPPAAHELPVGRGDDPHHLVSRNDGPQAERDAASRLAAEHAAAVAAAEAAVAQQASQLAAMADRLNAAESDARAQQERLENLQAELATATSLAQHATESRSSLETALERLDGEYGRQNSRATELETQTRGLQTRLESIRNTLNEHDLQLRRVTRQLRRGTADADTTAAVEEMPAANEPPAATAGANGAFAALVALGEDAGAGMIRALNGRTTIGRAQDNDLCLRDASVSRHHAVVVVSPKGALIEDLGTINGVIINGRRMRHAWLADGDTIALGLQQFRFARIGGARAGTA